MFICIIQALILDNCSAYGELVEDSLTIIRRYIAYLYIHKTFASEFRFVFFETMKRIPEHISIEIIICYA